MIIESLTGPQGPLDHPVVKVSITVPARDFGRRQV